MKLILTEIMLLEEIDIFLEGSEVSTPEMQKATWLLMNHFISNPFKNVDRSLEM